MEFPQLSTERTLLRQINSADADYFFQIYSDAESMRYRETKALQSREEGVLLIEKYLRDIHEGHALRWAIEIKASKQFAGTVVWKIQHPENEIGYSLDKKLWRQGLMSEVLQVVLNYLFTIRNLEFVTARVKAGNIASQKLLEKNGFTLFESNESWKKYKKLNSKS